MSCRKRFDGVVPFFVGQKRFHPLQLGQDRPLDAIELHAFGQFELPAGRRAENLRMERTLPARKQGDDKRQ